MNKIKLNSRLTRNISRLISPSRPRTIIPDDNKLIKRLKKKFVHNEREFIHYKKRYTVRHFQANMRPIINKKRGNLQ